MNLKMVGKYLGLLILAEAVFMLPAALAGFLFDETSSTFSLLISSGICLGLGALLLLLFGRASQTIYAREGFVIAGVGWLALSLLGALPFFISGEIPSFANAFFESVAGFTTTGVFIQSDISQWSRGLLFWRNFIQWLGGIGVLTFIITLVSVKGSPGASIHMFRAESPGPQVGKVRPKIRESVRLIYFVYVGLSLLALLFLLLGGMPLYDALCNMFGIAGTGGFGVRNDSMASYSTYIQCVCTVFMLLFGTNFALYPLLLAGNWRQMLRDEELRLYGLIVFSSIGIIAGSLLWWQHTPLSQALHNSSFMVASVITSTGLSITSYNHWPGLARAILFLLMIVGAMGGSTAGGFKVGRLLMLLKSLRAGLYRMLHPRSVITIRLNGKALDETSFARTQLFLFVYSGMILLSFVLISVDGLPLETNLTAVIACINNIGPGFGLVGDIAHFGDYSLFSKIVLSVNMLLGRLEIFPILILFFPSTWSMKN